MELPEIKMHPIPCIDCLTLPICRATVKERPNDIAIALNIIAKKCSLVYEYLSNHCVKKMHDPDIDPIEYKIEQESNKRHINALFKYLRIDPDKNIRYTRM